MRETQTKNEKKIPQKKSLICGAAKKEKKK